MARKNLRQQTALKTKLRLTFIATTAAISGLVVLLIVVFNLTKKEEGRAATSMTFKQATTFQDTSGVLRGSINQKVIGVVVETSGKGTPVKVNSFTFSAIGTSMPIEQNIENARLWYTGNDPDFSIQQIVGTTIPALNDKPFVFSASQTLLPGKNFFWLTFDVLTNANSTPGTVDAICKEIRIGAISYLPVVGDPIGKRFVQSNIPFYSVGTYEHTLSFYLKRTFTLVAYQDEMGFGIMQEPQRWIPDIASFAKVWEQQTMALAIMPLRLYPQLQQHGLVMKIIFQDTQHIVVSKP